MMKRSLVKQMRCLALTLAVVALLASPSLAVDVDLVAIEGKWTPPGSGAQPVTMWGFAEDTGQACGSDQVWDLGSEIRAMAGETLTIHLRNCLSEPVSIFIPGQHTPLSPVHAGNRMTSLTAVASANGGEATYTWGGLKAGTYIYHSGTHLAKQVQMGLYGPLIVDASPDTAYNGADPLDYDHEVVLFYSEIDPARHNPPAPAYPNAYQPRFFLVNGQPYPAGAGLSAGVVGQTTLVRMFSACLDDIVPTLNGMHWELIAEDGNRYPFPKVQYTALLSPLKTLDALLEPAAEGTYPIFDRRLNLTNAGAGPGGMLTMLSAGAGTIGAPIAVDDLYSTPLGTTLNVTAPGVLLNDTGLGVLSAALDSGPSHGGLTLNANGSFSYTPDDGFTGTDSFTYTASSSGGTSAPATVTITVIANAAPVATGQSVATNEDTPVVITLSATDTDDNALTYSIVTQPVNGTLSGTPPNVTYTPKLNFNGSDSFTFKANDGLVDSNVATVNITVDPVNDPPTANPDFATTKQNTAVTINLTANDTDPDGNLNPASLSVATVSTRGGSITNLGNGSVTYTPKRNFRGTDTFTYTVKDSGSPPLTSNTATVTVNVVR